jgi:hypothetical protein
LVGAGLLVGAVIFGAAYMFRRTEAARWERCAGEVSRCLAARGFGGFTMKFSMRFSRYQLADGNFAASCVQFVNSDPPQKPD